VQLVKRQRTVRPWLFGIAFVALAGVAVDAAQVRRVPALRESVGRYVSPASPDRPIQAAFILQKSDCTGNLRMLDLLRRQSVRDRIALAVVWYAGPPTDSTFIRSALPQWARHVVLAPLPRVVLSELQRMGHESTPMLVVLDQRARIRLATQSPRSPREFAGLIRIVEGLTWIEEL
jgi:hypothetical protein